MVDVAQLVRVSVCGTEGRGFEPHLPPLKKQNPAFAGFCCIYVIGFNYLLIIF